MVMPCFKVVVDPFTFKLFISVTESPSISVLPLLSFTFDVSNILWVLIVDFSSVL